MNDQPTLAPPRPIIEARCPYFRSCGGCASQDVPYAQQVARKEAWLRQLFTPVMLPTTQWQPFLHSAEPYPLYFRSKMRFAFIEHDGKVWPSRPPKHEGEDIPIDRCFLQSESSNQVIRYIADWATSHHWELYDPTTGKGWLKHALIRQSQASGEMLVSLVTDDAPIPEQEAWVGAMRSTFPFITSLWQTATWGRSNHQTQDIHLWGAQTLLDRVGEYRFHVSPSAFFQTNGAMVHTLYQAVADQAALTGQETVWDLYAGSATIGLYLSGHAKKVVSVEQNSANCHDAQLNIVENQVLNLTLIEGSVEAALSGPLASQRPDIVIVDPPRAGLTTAAKAALASLPAHRLIYVSCNPVSCLRDVTELAEHGYQLRLLQGIDMFPHTWHCEMIAELCMIEET